MKNTGDSSKQLSMLNEQLSQKNRLVNASCSGRSRPTPFLIMPPTLKVGGGGGGHIAFGFSVGVCVHPSVLHVF